jgi:hypothetical protein
VEFVKGNDEIKRGIFGPLSALDVQKFPVCDWMSGSRKSFIVLSNWKWSLRIFG